MAEIGLIASVVGVAGAALTSSRALFEMVDEIRNAPEELSAISKDIHSFHDVVGSVQMAIRDRLVIKALLRDRKLCELVTNLEAPLQNCSSILTLLKPRIEPHLKKRSDGKFRVSSIDVRWILKKKDIIDCRNRLEVTKSTLDAALTSVIFFCSLRCAGQDVDSVLNSDASAVSRDLDAGSVLREYAESIAPRSPPLDAVSLINPVELLAELSSNPAEFHAEAAGHPSSYSNSPRQKSPSGTSSINPEATEQVDGVLKSNETSKRPNSTTDGSLTPHSSAKRFFKAAKEGDQNLIKAMLQEGYDVNHASEAGETTFDPEAGETSAEVGVTALHRATRWGWEDLVRMLLANNANVNAKTQTHNLTPLHDAARFNYKSIVGILLDNGADIAARDTEGHIALGGSIYQGHDDTSIELIRRASTVIDNFDTFHTPLQWAVFYNRPKVVEALIARGKQLGQIPALFDAGDCEGCPPLTLASGNGHIEIVSQLLAAGANIDECYLGDWTPLIYAAYNGQTEMMDFLIAQGADRQARSDGTDYLQILKQYHPEEHEKYIGKAES